MRRTPIARPSTASTWRTLRVAAENSDRFGLNRGVSGGVNRGTDRCAAAQSGAAQSGEAAAAPKLNFEVLSKHVAIFASLLVLSVTNLALLKLLPWRERKFDLYLYSS